MEYYIIKKRLDPETQTIIFEVFVENIGVMTKQEIIKLIENNNNVFTKDEYGNIQKVIIEEKIANVHIFKFIKTIPNGLWSDNLDNLPSF